ncbi:MAG TPA: DUF3891 family protein [Vicinamibacterales bacterium]|nr:DUF3891 family protein [Vicinamibacterales bacterium]
MIIRPTPRAWLVITQSDHARLAGEVLAYWRADGLPGNPRRDRILLAAREHDNGWIEEDDATHVGPEGQPLDFVEAPDHVRQRVWPRAVERIAGGDAYAAALIALHALTIYGSQRGKPEWAGFFDGMAALMERERGRSGVDRADLEADYRFVHAADRISLALCTGWHDVLESSGRRIILAGNTVQVSPSPFEQPVAMRVRARRLARRPFASSAELASALRAAPPEWLEGWTRGE